MLTEAIPVPPTEDLRAELRSLLDRGRRRTQALLAPLDDEDVHRQFVDFMSPLVWDVGHVGNFEELWLLRHLGGRQPHDPDLDRLYNPFENPRWVRGDLPILDRAAALPYLADVRRDAVALLDRLELDPDEPLLRDGYVYRMIGQHEAQHQETMLQALGLRDDLTGYPLLDDGARVDRSVDDEERVTIPGGPCTIGTTDRTWAYDNERPRHEVDVGRFAIDRFPVTTRRYARFVADGGYQRPELWSPGGREWLDAEGHCWPQGWLPVGQRWALRRFGHVRELDPREPVEHVCYWEAEAFARWAGGRLPTEVEWEKAAAWDPSTARARPQPWGHGPPTAERANVGLRHHGPRPVGAYPAGASAYGVEQAIGDVYEWTSSDFAPYPGYSTFPYPEYSQVFFGPPHGSGGGYKVLRGASWAIAGTVARPTYRNWDWPERRQVFAGLRVAWDLPPVDGA